MRSLTLLVCSLALVACKDKKSEPAHEPPKPVAADAAAAPAIDAAVAAADASAPSDTAAAPPAGDGVDFSADAQRLFRVVGCGGEGPLPDDLAKFQKVVDKHCKTIAPDVEKFRAANLEIVKKWMAEHAPADIPKTIVYPFGGGDLLSALIAFPDATEITTISLELAGDPRRWMSLTPGDLDKSLAAFRKEIEWLVAYGSNTSVNLSAQQKNAVPGQVSSFLLAMHVAGYEPVGMRYFHIDDTGKLIYVDQAKIDADTSNTKPLSERWHNPAFAESYRNVELTYRKVGETTLRTHRHIAWNLDNKHLQSEPGVLRHLEAKGKVTIIVKGASYLLWRDEFTTMRKYILDHLAWMISDSTGIPPMYAKPAGMEQETYGKFVQPGLDFAVGGKEDLDMRNAWKASKGPAPFRFGYIDSNNNWHIMITRPKQ
ncbi:MAG TPA: hypothetical protein VFQ53_08660 [Kofleriaceae bacterium]|nr:hypothetical protein [Kofleriaceae bacterium]